MSSSASRTILLVVLVISAGFAPGFLPVGAQCVSGDVPHEILFNARATVGIDDFWLDPVPEMFMNIFVDGSQICNVRR